MKRIVVWLMGFLFLTSLTALADSSLNPSLINLPYPGLYSSDWPVRLTGWVMGGDEGAGEGDSMIRLFGNDQSMAYADLQGKYSTDNNWFGGAGLGFRALNNNARILGAYVFADRNDFQQSGYGHHAFWFVSPGIESMGNLWDFRVNGYFPVNEKYQSKKTMFADQAGNDSFVTFDNHLEFDRLVTVLYETSTGIGTDAEIGRAMPGFPNTRVYLGGYYFAPKQNREITGIAGRLLIPFDHAIAVEVADSYDNVFHNSIQAGMRFTLGGNSNDVDRTNKDISRRMFDPISRNLAQLRQGTAEPITVQKTLTHMTQQSKVENGNIWFFSPSGSPFNPANGANNCTFEHPCNILDQATIDGINGLAPNAYLYFDTGTFNNPSVGTGFNIPFGQSLFGRTNNFRDPAPASNLPIINDTLFLNGNNTVDNLLINGHTQASSGTVPVLTAIEIGNTATGTINLNNDIITASNDGDPALPTITAVHVAANTPVTVNINQSSLSASAQNIPDDIDAIALYNERNGNIIINNSGIIATNLNNADGGNAIAVLNNATGSIQINNSSLEVNSNNDNVSIIVGNLGTMDVFQSNLSMTANNSATPVIGIFNVGSINLNSVNIDATANNNIDVTGLMNLGTATIRNTAINVTTGGIADAVNNTGTLLDLGGNVCTENGSSVSCS